MYGIFPLGFDGPFLPRYAVETFGTSRAAERRCRDLYGPDWRDHAAVRECEAEEETDDDGEYAAYMSEQAADEAAAERHQERVVAGGVLSELPPTGGEELPY